MSKEYLEALERLKTAPSFMGGTAEYKACTKSETLFMQDYEIVKQALQRLAAIDNANPSEALKCLETICRVMKDYTNMDIKWVFKNDYNTIKQALLKAQEPKQYLKWEDLEFKEKEQTMKVIFNGKEYILKYEKLKDYDVDRVRILDEFFYKYMMFHTSTKQFFNDLHLERVE